MPDDIKRTPLAGAVAAVIGAGIQAGYVIVLSVWVSGDGDQSSFLLLRQLIATFLILLWAALQNGWQVPRKEHILRFVGLGFLNFLNAVGYIWGVTLTTALLTSIMQTTIPVMALVVGLVTKTEAFSKKKTIAIFLTVVGCSLVAAGNDSSGSSEDDMMTMGVTSEFALGIVILIAQCASYVVLVITQRPVLDSYPILYVIGWSYGICVMFVFIYCIASGTITTIDENLSSFSAVMIILYSSVAGSIGYFWLIAFASKHLTPTQVGISVLLEPLFTCIIGIVGFGAMLGYFEIFGFIGAILGGVTLSIPEHTNEQNTDIELTSPEEKDPAHVEAQDEATTTTDATPRAAPLHPQREKRLALYKSMRTSHLM